MEPSSSSSSNISVRKGAWTGEEDILLKKCIQKFGEGKWHQVPSRAGLNRCRKSCRLRWMNYLKPDIKRGDFDADEIDLIIRLHKLLGNRWSLIAGRLPGRTANDVKNYWNTHLLKKNPISSTNNNAHLNPKSSYQSPSKPNTKLIKPRAQILPKSANFSFSSSNVVNNATAIPPSNISVVSTDPNSSSCNASYCVADEANAIMWWENLLMNEDDQQQDNPMNYETNLNVYKEPALNEELGNIRTKVVEKGSNYDCLDELFLDVELWNGFNL